MLAIKLIKKRTENHGHHKTGSDKKCSYLFSFIGRRCRCCAGIQRFGFFIYFFFIFLFLGFLIFFVRLSFLSKWMVHISDLILFCKIQKKIQQPLYYKSYCLLGWIQVPLSLFVVVLAWFSLDPIQAESFSNYIVSFSVVMIILRHLFLHHIRQTCLIICMYSLNAT